MRATAVLLVILASVFVRAQDDAMATYTEQYAGIQFSYPASWKITKKERDRVYMAIPIAGSTETATLQVIHTDFHADKEIWQKVQEDVNKQMNRDIVRQWEQDILGVPMLFTRINYVDHGVARSALTGLYYTRTPQKLLIRIDCREADYDNIVFLFSQTLETIKTLDGSALMADDPNVKLSTTSPKAEPVPEPPKVLFGNNPGPKVEIPNQKAELTVSERKVNLMFPTGWKLETAADGTVTLQSDELSAPITVTLFTTLDSDPPLKTLFKASSESLKLYTKVDMREDTNPTANRASAMIATTWRNGKTSSGDLATFESTGQSGELYFLLTFKTDKTASIKSDRRLLQDLVSRMTIEPAQ